MVEYLTYLALLGLTVEQLGIIIGIIFGLIGIWTGWKALRISNFAIFPDIEFDYILKNIDPKYLEKHHEYKENFDKFNERYANQYSHLIIVNKGNGKASNIDVAYNWDLDGTGTTIHGYSSEYLEGGYKVSSKDYLFPGEEMVDIPTIDFGCDDYEESLQLLIRVKYKDSIGNTYCKCKYYFRKEQTQRRFDIINEYCKTCQMGLLKKISIKLLGGRSCNFEEK